MHVRVPALTIIRHICHCNQKCSLPSAVLGWLGRSQECLELRGENQNIFLLLGRLGKGQMPRAWCGVCCATDSFPLSPLCFPALG